MISLNCIECGIEFGLAGPLYERRVKDHRDFTCPNGHKQRFTGKSDEQKAIERLERIEQTLWESNRELTEELEVWKQLGRHCPICHERVSQARSSEVAAHKLSLHLQQTHNARGALLALMPGASA